MSATSRKAYLVITCTFLLGLFVGLIISPLVWRQSPAAPPNLSGMVDELSVELSLTPDQRQQVDVYEELYWRVLLAAGIVLCVGMLLLRTRLELAWSIAGISGVLLLIGSLF